MASVDGEEAGLFSMGQTGEGRRESAGEEMGDVEEPNKGEETKMEKDGGGGK